MPVEVTGRCFRLRLGIAVLPMPGGVQLRAGDDEIHFLKTGEPESIVRLLDLLRKPHSFKSLADLLGDEVFHATNAIIDQLALAGLVIDTADVLPNQWQYLSHYRAHNPQITPPKDVRTIIFGESGLAKVIANMLEEHECSGEILQAFPESMEQRSNQVAVIVWERPDLSFVSRANRFAIQHNLPCLFADLSHGRHSTLGPFFLPGEGACYECFRQRWRQNSASLVEMDAAHDWMMSSGAALEPYGTLPVYRHWLASMTVAEVLAYYVRHRPLRTLNRAVTIDFEGMSTSSEPVWRLPACSACYVSL